MKTIQLMLGVFIIFCLAIPAFADDEDSSDDVEVCNVTGQLVVDFSAEVSTFSCPASDPSCTTEIRFNQSSGLEIFSGGIQGEYVAQKQCQISSDFQYIDCTGTGLLVGEVCGEDGSLVLSFVSHIYPDGCAHYEFHLHDGTGDLQNMTGHGSGIAPFPRLPDQLELCDGPYEGRVVFKD